jgi:transposase
MDENMVRPDAYITKAGNPHVRRLLAEAAWAYQGIPRIGRQPSVNTQNRPLMDT